MEIRGTFLLRIIMHFSEDNHDEVKVSFVDRFTGYVKANISSLVEMYRERKIVNAENKQARLEYRRGLREANARRRHSHLTERIFMLLDYNPTNSESGEEDLPTIKGALFQWAHRVIWTRRIELFGFLFLVIIGIVCYYAITAP